MSENPQNRPVKVILGDALDELRAREERLSAFEQETAEARKAIKVLSRAIGEDKHPQPTARNPSGDTKRAILEALASAFDPLSMEEIAAKIGREPAGWLSMQIKKQIGAGRIVQIGEKYGLASPIQTQDAA